MGGGGRPAGCALRKRLPEARCSAEIKGERCQLCVRATGMRWAGETDGRGWYLRALRSIEIRETGRKPHRWAVVVLVGGWVSDPEYPITLCRTKRRAVSIALQRARQIEPHGGRTRRWRGYPGWSRRRLRITFARVYL